MTAGEDRETIVACASPPGSSAEAIIRLSGPLAFALVEPGFSTDRPWPPEGGRGAAPGWLELADGRPPLPLALWRMPGPRSFTGEDVAELHLPGNPLLVRRVLDALIAAGAAPAGPGAFIRRAYESGRMDLLQVEAVLALIRAEDDAEAQAALCALGGQATAALDAVAHELLAASAVLEASLDFADRDLDDDLAADLEGEAAAALRPLVLRCAELVPDGEDERPRILLFGAANAGKSTLFNALLGEQRAVVDAAPGTTRDPVVAPWSVEGLPVSIVDPAGQGEAIDPLDAKAQAAARGMLGRSDLVLLIAPRGAAWPELGAHAGALLRVRSKADLDAPSTGVPPTVVAADVEICALRGEGLDQLRAAIVDRLRGQQRAHRAFVGARQRACLDRARSGIERALALLDQGRETELAALELAESREALGELSGEVLPDDLLGAIFDRFCVGK